MHGRNRRQGAFKAKDIKYATVYSFNYTSTEHYIMFISSPSALFFDDVYIPDFYPLILRIITIYKQLAVYTFHRARVVNVSAQSKYLLCNFDLYLLLLAAIYSKHVRTLKNVKYAPWYIGSINSMTHVTLNGEWQLIRAPYKSKFCTFTAASCIDRSQRKRCLLIPTDTSCRIEKVYLKYKKCVLKYSFYTIQLVSVGIIIRPFYFFYLSFSQSITEMVYFYYY